LLLSDWPEIEIFYWPVYGIFNWPVFGVFDWPNLRQKQWGKRQNQWRKLAKPMQTKSKDQGEN